MYGRVLWKLRMSLLVGLVLEPVDFVSEFLCSDSKICIVDLWMVVDGIFTTSYHDSPHVRVET